ncbi:MAG: hypothetical protein AAGF95_10695 [Chloroflexota bacterium]
MTTTLKTMYTRFTNAMTDEQGAEMVEWVGMLAIVLIAAGVVATAVGDGDYGETFTNKIKNAINTPTMQWGGGGGNN